ncbi:MAG TPA: TorF family putative porin [Allosphingosinicella sp.]|nr:TorF family putative porin [Allosphingosinicella sp.]
MLELPPPDPHIEFVLASRGYSKGLAQTDGVQALLRGEVEWRALTAAAQVKNVDSGASEAQFQLGVAGDPGGFELEAAIGYKRLTGLPSSADEDAVEFTGSASRAFGPVRPRLAVTFSFDDLGGTRESLYAEAGASLRLSPRTSISASLGRRERRLGDDYTAFSAGLSRRIGEHLTAELRYHDTARSARGDPYQARAVASLRVRF